MSQETANVKAATEHSPVAEARAQLHGALQRLETLVHSRLEAAARAALTVADTRDADSEQWQNACRMLETQLEALKDENSQLHSELHQARAQVQELRRRNTELEATRETAAAALDAAIASVESLLKEA